MEGLFKDLNDEQLSRLIMDDLQHEIAVVSETLQTMKPNMGAIKEYRRKEKDYNERMAELDTVTETRDSNHIVYTHVCLRFRRMRRGLNVDGRRSRFSAVRIAMSFAWSWPYMVLKKDPCFCILLYRIFRNSTSNLDN